MNNSKRVVGTVIAAMTAEIINKIVPLIVIHYAQLQLGITSFGYAQFGIYMVDLLIPFIVWGYHTYGTIRVGKIRNSHEELQTFLGSIIGLKLVHALAVFLVITIVMFTMPRYQVYMPLVYTLSFIFLSSSFDLTFAMQGTQKMHWVSAFSLSAKLLSLAAILLFVKDPNDAILFAGLSFGANALVSLCSLIFMARRTSIRIQWSLRDFVPIFRASWPYGVSFTLIYLADRVDLFWVETLFSNREVGLYAGALRLQQAISPFIVTVGAVFFGEAVGARSASSLQTLTQYGLMTVLSIAMPIAAGTFFVAEPLLALILGDVFVALKDVLPIMISGLVAYCFTVILGQQVLMLNQRIKLYNVLLFCSILITSVLNLFLGRHFGLIGVAYGSLCGKAFIAVVVCWVSSRYLRFFPWQDIIRVAAPTGGMIAVLSLTQDSHWAYLILYGTVSYALLFVGLNYKQLKDVIGRLRT